MRQRAGSIVGLVIGGFFLVGGLLLRQLGESGWPLGDAADALGTNPAGDVLGMIGTIWAGVGGLLVLMFLLLSVVGRRAGAVVVPDAPPPAPLDHEGFVEGLTRLAALKDRGLLSDEEWSQAKALFLGKPVDHRLADARLLEELHDLYEAGGLSESEFNSKKWEILSRN